MTSAKAAIPAGSAGDADGADAIGAFTDGWGSSRPGGSNGGSFGGGVAGWAVLVDGLVAVARAGAAGRRRKQQQNESKPSEFAKGHGRPQYCSFSIRL